MQNDRLVGTWKLISFEVHLSDGSVMEPYGDDPIGMAIFDRNYNFIAQLMRSNRKNFDADNQLGGTPEEIKEAFEGCTAYFGNCEFKDEKTFVNKVEGSLYPNWIGGEQVRYYRFYDNILELKAPSMKMGDVEFSSILKWERVT